VTAKRHCVVVFLLASVCSCTSSDSLEYKYSRVKTGMTKDEVISILGKKDLTFTLKEEDIPRAPKVHGGVPAVKGEEALQWTRMSSPRLTIYVGFSEGKVVDKTLRKPSL